MYFKLFEAEFGITYDLNTSGAVMRNARGIIGETNLFHRNTKWLKDIKRFEILRTATQHLVTLHCSPHYVPLWFLLSTSIKVIDTLGMAISPRLWLPSVLSTSFIYSGACIESLCGIQGFWGSCTSGLRGEIHPGYLAVFSTALL